jgi:hypothetical protein
MEKMVSTYLLKNQITTQPDASYGILCGPVSGYLANKKWTYSVDPQNGTTTYVGQAERGGILGGLVDNYGLSLQVSKNGELQVLKVV